jgi:uncharacterized membrane protein YeiH
MSGRTRRRLKKRANDRMLKIIEILGVAFFALAGGIEAERKGMDLVGIYVIAFVTALGGGTLRDLLLDRHPLFWISSPEYALIILAMALAAAIIKKTRKVPLSDRAVVVPDAFGLGFFTATGTAVAFGAGKPPFICILMGVITATFGGVLRDIACNEVPVIFKRGQLYATCSFLAALVFWALRAVSADHAIAMTACMVTGFVLRLLAVRYDLKLPL